MKHTFKFQTIILLICLLIAESSSSQTVIKNEGNESLKVLSWNIKLLPVPLNKIEKYKRAGFIAKHLNGSDYDIIVFQEAFDNKVRQTLFEYMRDKFPYQAGPANNKKSFLVANSGVWIIGRFPLQIISEVKYNDCGGTDCLGRKGAILVEVIMNNRKFQLAGTHLQAGESEKNALIRVKQYKQLNEELLEPHFENDVIQIICGDFNTPNNSAFYNIMIETLNVSNGEITSEYQYTYDGRINDMIKRKKDIFLFDYIFIKNDHDQVNVSRAIKQFSDKWHKRKKNLSDHFALELTYIY